MRVLAYIGATVLMTSAFIGCSATPKTEGDRVDMHNDVEAAIAQFKEKDPSMEELFDSAYGYAVFPSVKAGAIGVGGAFGRGEVYEQGRLVGYCDLTQGSIGLALGGQAYRQIIFFERRAPLERFQRNELAFSAQASAVAVTTGGAATAPYKNGVSVFSMTKAGLMAEASIGGQRFTYEAK